MSKNFTAEPRIVVDKPKYKESDEFDSKNIMIDKRVYRGNTHNAFLMKKTALALSGKTAEEVNDKQKQMDKIRHNILK
jgi:hypothetical protein